MNFDLFEYEMKVAGYRTVEQRAKALGISRSSYYKRFNKKSECSKKEMDNVAAILGKDVMNAIFFGD